MSATVRGLIFIVCALLLVPGLFGKTLGEAERYGYLADIIPADWAATNVWLDSTDCTLARGTWLALCEDGKLVPISERAQADPDAPRLWDRIRRLGIDPSDNLARLV